MLSYLADHCPLALMQKEHKDAIKKIGARACSGDSSWPLAFDIAANCSGLMLDIMLCIIFTACTPRGTVRTY